MALPTVTAPDSLVEPASFDMTQGSGTCSVHVSKDQRSSVPLKSTRPYPLLDLALHLREPLDEDDGWIPSVAGGFLHTPAAT